MKDLFKLDVPSILE